MVSPCTAEPLGCSSRSGCPPKQLFPGQGDFQNFPWCWGEMAHFTKEMPQERWYESETALRSSGIDGPSSIDPFGKFQPFQDPSIPCQKTVVHGLMSEVCHALGREMGQLSASALSPVPETELGFNGEQGVTVLPAWLCHILEPGANHLPICAGITALPAGCPRPGRQKADDSTMPAWDLLWQRTPVTRTGRWRSSLEQRVGQRAGPADSTTPMQILRMGLENQESPKQRAGVSLHCCLVPRKPYMLHRMIPVMASSKPASIPIPALRFQSILVSRRSGGGR